MKTVLCHCVRKWRVFANPVTYFIYAENNSEDEIDLKDQRAEETVKVNDQPISETDKTGEEGIKFLIIISRGYLM